ncbi:MAG: LytTR family DNA-binding domain-containing protein [Planctomycetota bacterium]
MSDYASRGELRPGHWLFAVLVGVGCALIGPYGTYLTMPTEFRFAYWVGTILVGFNIWWQLERLCFRVMRESPYLLIELAVIPPFAILNASFLYVLHESINRLLGMRMHADWLNYLVSNLVLSTIVIVPMIMLARHLMRQLRSRAGGDAIELLTQKFPPQLRGSRPFALAADGHYVRVYTTAGEGLVTMKFEDALRAVVGIDGFQTHRSWWVARDEVVDLRPNGSSSEISMTSGLKVPVSRRKRASVVRALRS